MSNLLSLCMIVKNEEKVLDRCLRSVQGLADEIVIVDTGSTDRTKEIAAKYTDRIYDYKWQNDFAAARNESLRHATGRWILVLDADEYVQPNGHAELRRLLETRSSAKNVCYLLKIMNMLGQESGGQMHFMESQGARLFANTPGIHYEEPIHEQLRSNSGPIAFEALSDFSIYHSGYTDEVVAEKQKTKRNLGILEKLKTPQRLKDPYYCYVLGNEYANGKNEAEAYRYYKKSYEKSKPTDAWYIHLLDRFLTVMIKLNKHGEAYRLVQEARKRRPDVVDYHCLQGIILEHYGLYPEAASCFEECLKIADAREAVNQPYWLVQTNYGRIIPHQMLAEIARKRGNLHQMVHHLTKTLQVQPTNFGVLRHLLFYLSQSDRADSVAAFVEKLYPMKEPLHALLLLKVSMTIGNPELAARYVDMCEQANVPLSSADRLTYDLLQHRPSALKPSAEDEIPEVLALMASIVYQDTRYLDSLASNEESMALGRELLRTSQEQAVQDVSSPPNSPLILELLVRLLVNGYSDLYDRILQRWLQPELLNALAVQLSDIGLAELAMNYFELALDNNVLSGAGHKEVGRMLLLQNELEQGIDFLRAALEMAPSEDLIGIAKTSAGALLPSYRQFLASYLDVYPEAKVLPLS